MDKRFWDGFSVGWILGLVTVFLIEAIPHILGIIV